MLGTSNSLNKRCIARYPRSRGRARLPRRINRHIWNQQDQQDEDESASQVEHRRPHLQMAAVNLQKRASAERKGAQRRQSEKTQASVHSSCSRSEWVFTSGESCCEPTCRPPHNITGQSPEMLCAKVTPLAPSQMAPAAVPEHNAHRPFTL